MSAFFVGAVIILSLCVLLSPTVSAVSSAAVSAIRVPVWAFNGAYANYTLTETVANQTADSGWETFTINQVNATAGTFNMTTSFFDQAQASRGQGVRTQNGVFALNQSFVFPALNSSQLDMLNQGKLPGIGQNASV
ncbi:MAG: hypothetical protein ACREBQ_08670, partial [Nitrososphaerales archaeon]